MCRSEALLSVLSGVGQTVYSDVEGEQMRRRTRALLLTQWLNEDSAELGPMGLRGRLIGAMQDHDIDVEVVSGPLFDMGANKIPAGQKWWKISEGRAGNSPVHRYPFYPGHSESSLDRMLLYASFAASTSTLAQRQLKWADVIVVDATPATAAAAAMVTRLARGTPYVLMIQDVWPDSIFASGFLTGRLRPVAEATTSRFVESSYRLATRLTALSPGMRRLLVDRGVPSHKIDVVYNWADEHLYSNALRVPPRLPTEPLHILYAGNLGPPQALETVIDTVARFPSEEVRLSIAGDGIAEPTLRALAASLPSADVRFLGRLSPPELRIVEETAHLHLISLRDDPLFRITVPSKTQTLLCAGAAILTFAPGEVAEIVASAGAGITSIAGSAASLEAAIRAALRWPPTAFQECGSAGREYYFAHMCEGINAPRLAETTIKAVAERQSPHRRRYR